jgi:hypothetical protein
MAANLTQADIDALLDGLTNRILTRPDLAQRLRGAPGPQGPQGVDGAAGNNQLVDTRWRLEEFGLFEPDL